MKRWPLLVLALACGISACQSPEVPSRSAPSLQAASLPQKRTQSDRFLCSMEPGNGGFTMLKVMDLSNRTVRSVFVPGQVLSVDGVPSERKLYLSSREGEDQPQFTLFEVDVEKLLIRRAASFSQAGLWPSDFLVRNNQLLASGTRQGQGLLLNLDLVQGGWQNLVHSFATGNLEWGKTPDQVQAVAFDEDRITRTTIDIRQKRILNVQSFNHGIPFGNNVGLSSPDASYFYALHQLKGEVEIYSYDIASGASNNLISAEKAVGILYSSVISRDGRFLYATIDNKIHRYELIGTQMKRLPPIELRTSEARYLALSHTGPVLYVSHDRKNSVSQITLQADGSYTIQDLPYPGQNNEIFVF